MQLWTSELVAIIGDTDDAVIVEGSIIDGDPAVDRALNILGQRPPFNGDPRVTELEEDPDTYFEAQDLALDASHICEAVEPHFGIEGVDCIAVGSRAAVALKRTARTASVGGATIDVFSDTGFRNAIDEIAGPHAALLAPEIHIS